jgi:hypothetical protein
VTGAIAAEKGHSQITAWTLLRYWLHEAAWGAAGRAAHGGLQRQRTDDRAKQADHIARSKPRVDVVTRISCKPGSAERHANPEIHKGAQAKSNISAGVDQQEVRRS